MPDAAPLHQLSFAPTFDDVFAAYRLSLPSARRNYANAIAALILGPIDVLLAALFPSDSAAARVMTDIGIGAFGIGLVLLVYFAFARTILFKRKIRRIFMQQAAFRDTHDIAWSEAGLSVTSPVGSTAMPWERFTKFREGTATFLLYQSDAMFNFLPKRIMSPEQIAAFRSHVVPRVAAG